MKFKKNTVAVKGGQIDTFTLEINFEDLPEKAVEEIKDNYIDCPEITVDIENGVILITEEISHGIEV